eukprot:3933665-Rhodomonas_salina.2
MYCVPHCGRRQVCQATVTANIPPLAALAALPHHAPIRSTHCSSALYLATAASCPGPSPSHLIATSPPGILLDPCYPGPHHPHELPSHRFARSQTGAAGPRAATPGTASHAS